MAGTFILGETKIRPGAYFNIQKKSGKTVAGIMNGVTAVVFKADFGPLNTAVELSAEDGYEGIFGTGLTTDAIRVDRRGRENSHCLQGGQRRHKGDHQLTGYRWGRCTQYHCEIPW